MKVLQKMQVRLKFSKLAASTPKLKVCRDILFVHQNSLKDYISDRDGKKARRDKKRKECVTNLLLFNETTLSCFFLSIVLEETVAFPVNVVLDTLSPSASLRAPSRLTIRL